MGKNEKKKHRNNDHDHDWKGAKRVRVRRESMPPIEANESRAIDWAPLFEAAEGALIWAHDLARDVCRPEECAAIERTFRVLYARLDGRETDAAPLVDVLTTLRAIGRAVETDLGLWRGSFDLLAEMLAVAFASPREIVERAGLATAHPRALVGLVPTPQTLPSSARPGVHIDVLKLFRELAERHLHA